MPLSKKKKNEIKISISLRGNLHGVVANMLDVILTKFEI